MNFLQNTVEIMGHTVTIQFLVSCFFIIIGVLFIIKASKKAIKLIMLTVVILNALVSYHILSQEDVIKVGAKLKDMGITSYEEYKDAIDSVKVIEGELSIITDSGWLQQKDIKNVTISNGIATIITKNNKVYTSKDKYVIKLLKTLYNKGN